MIIKKKKKKKKLIQIIIKILNNLILKKNFKEKENMLNQVLKKIFQITINK